MKLILITTMILSLGLLTACGGSSGGSKDGGSDVGPGKPGPSNGGPAEVPKDTGVVSDLESLPSSITEEVKENQLFALTIPEYKNTNTYTFTGVDGDNVELSSEDGTVVFKLEADYETQPVYNFIMTVTNASDQTKDIDVTINIMDIPEDLNSLPSVITESVSENSRFAFTIPEYKDTNSYAFTGVDGDSVKLWAERGEVIFKYAPDYEDLNHQPSYSFIMTVTNEMEQTKSIDVTVNINDVTNDFIFEVLAGSEGTLDLVINHDSEEMFNEFSFEIYKNGNLDRTITRSGNIEKEFLQLKNNTNELGETQLYTIKPTTPNGLPSIKIRPNWRAVKIKVIQWGDNEWKSLNDMFSSLCINGDHYESIFLSFAESQSSPNLKRVDNMSKAFQNCDIVQNVGYWDVSSVTNMNELFSVDDDNGFLSTQQSFNADISQWNTLSVESMDFMFSKTEVFDQNLSGWNVAKVTSCTDFKFNALLSEANTPNFQNCSM